MQIVRTNQFKKDFKLCLKRGKNPEKLQKVIELLCSDADLPQKYRSHKLVGNWEGCWELHIESDWLLIYILTADTLELISTGTHSDLFD